MTSYNKNIIVLDLRKNDYNILPEELSDILRTILKSRFKLKNNKFVAENAKNIVKVQEDELDEIIKYFIDNKYIKPNPVPYHALICLEPNIKRGANNIDWRIKPEDIELSCSIKEFCKAYLVLIRVVLSSFFLSFKTLINTIKVPNKLDFKDNPTSDLALQTIVNTLNTACFYFPVRIKCLEWAVAFTILAHKNKLKCNLEIGVQNIPFLAHAWVKTKHGIIADDNNLDESLSVILSEPFLSSEL